MSIPSRDSPRGSRSRSGTVYHPTSATLPRVKYHGAHLFLREKGMGQTIVVNNASSDMSRPKQTTTGLANLSLILKRSSITDWCSTASRGCRQHYSRASLQANTYSHDALYPSRERELMRICKVSSSLNVTIGCCADKATQDSFEHVLHTR